jgi:hypothetical protein
VSDTALQIGPSRSLSGSFLMELGSEGVTEMPPQDVATSYCCIESLMQRRDTAALARDSCVTKRS